METAMLFSSFAVLKSKESWQFSRRSEELFGFSKAGVSGEKLWAIQCGFQKLNSGPLEELQVPSTAELTL
ncbi:hypothetical protein ACRRTK_018141 [Alexandromys fortis]